MFSSHPWAQAALLAVSATALAQSPAQVRPVPQEAPDLRQPPPPPLDPRAEIYNTLWITDRQDYINGIGDAWSGRGLFGELYDLQTVDDVLLAGDCCIDELARDYVTFLGAVPANGTYIALYEMTAEGRPEEQAFIEMDGVPMEVAHFSDTIFGLVGVRGTVRPGGSICAPAGRWFVETQPHDESEPGDWYYVVEGGICLDGDVFMRDGGRANGGFGFTTWKGTWDFGFGCAVLAMAVRGECGPPRLVCVYEVASVELRSSVCGDRCDRCPVHAGQLICANECPGGEGECAGRVKGFSVCSNGGVCLVRAIRVTCDVPPIYCKSCL
ncbi:MAG: hypothetical protein IT449_02080 [Phycisphaerales bacterium]|nr:hypothetical protein [Phycisphaerales bacterium]